MSASKLQTIVPSDAPKIHVIFVHGLDGDWRGTWRSTILPDEDKYGWPAWLADVLGPGYAIHAFDYPAFSSGWKGNTLPMFDRAEDLLEEIDLNLSGDARLFFICHSLGGLMVKKMLSVARDKSGTKKAVLTRTVGVLFLGTPHQGSGVANIVNKVLPTLISRASITLEELERSNPDLRALGQTFRTQAFEYKWKVHQYAEGKDTRGVRVVDEHSANSTIGDFVVADEDHISLPKVASRESKIFKRALVMLQGCDGGCGTPAEAAIPGGSSPPDTSSWTRAEVEKVLNANPVVRGFLQQHTPGLIVEQAGGFRLGEAVGTAGFDLCPILEKVRDRMDLLNGSRTDLDDLEKVLGGLLVMAVDPHWVSLQEQAKTEDVVEFPARLDWLPLGDGNRANLLHIVAAALADGFARLPKLFGDPPGQADDRCLPAVPAEFGGISETDVGQSLKAHFARCILGPEAAPNPADVKDVDLAFEQARSRMRRERVRERRPYWAADSSYRPHTNAIRDPERLGLVEFFLLFPTGRESEDKILPRSMDVLCELHHIFAAIKARRAALQV